MHVLAWCIFVRHRFRCPFFQDFPACPIVSFSLYVSRWRVLHTPVSPLLLSFPMFLPTRAQTLSSVYAYHLFALGRIALHSHWVAYQHICAQALLILRLFFHHRTVLLHSPLGLLTTGFPPATWSFFTQCSDLAYSSYQNILKKMMRLTDGS